MRVGFIGLGNIGMPMARRLVDAGHDVAGVDTVAARTDELSGAGGDRVQEPAQLADRDVVCLAVPDDAACRAVLLDSGLLDELGEGAAVLLHSTLLPETARDLAERGAERGVAVHDAPVSGGAERAANGSLTLMVGGDPEQRPTEVLETLGSVVRCGPVGAGAAVKLANQLSMLASLGALHEGLALAERYGASERTVLDVLSTSTGASWCVESWGFFDDLAGVYDDAGVPVRYRPWSKDLWDVVATARQADLPVPVAAILAQVMPERVEQHARRAREGRSET